MNDDNPEANFDKNFLSNHLRQQKSKQKFEDTVKELVEQIEGLKKRVNKVHMHMNKRDSTIVRDVTDEVEAIVHKAFYQHEGDVSSENE